MKGHSMMNFKKISLKAILFYPFTFFNTCLVISLLLATFDRVMMDYSKCLKCIWTNADKPFIAYNYSIQSGTFLFITICSILLYKHNPYWSILFALLPILCIIVQTSYNLHFV